jgi:dsRNA-specific ribonuclease
MTSSPSGVELLYYQEWTTRLREQTLQHHKHDPLKSPDLWIESFKSYLFLLLEPILPSPEIRRYVVNGDRFLSVFVRAFRDTSFSADDYETLECIGDRELGRAFAFYIYERFRGVVTREETTNFIAFYMSKHFQPQLTRELSLSSYFLMSDGRTATTKMEEDLFESFAAALSLVCTTLHADAIQNGNYEMACKDAPTGSEAVFKLIRLIFDAKGIDRSRGAPVAKNVLLQLSDLMAMRSSQIIFSSSPQNSGGMQDYTITVPYALINALASAGLPNVPRVLVSGTFGSEREAAEAALANLVRTSGYSQQWAENVRSFSSSQILGEKIGADKLADFISKLKTKDCCSKFIFVTPEKTRNGQQIDVILQGIRVDDSRVTLAAISNACVDQLSDAKARLVLNYLAADQ